MDAAGNSKLEQDSGPVFVKADEIDETGADISTNAPAELGQEDFGELGEDGFLTSSFRNTEEIKWSEPEVNEEVKPSATANVRRPPLRRDQSHPPPPLQPPPPPASQQMEVGNPTDSLSLLQLKRIVTEFPRFEPTPYAFVYTDTTTYAEELEEWFQYTAEDRERLLRARLSFEEKWDRYTGEPTQGVILWTESATSMRTKFVAKEVAGLENPNAFSRESSIEALLYLTLGVWAETGGLETSEQEANSTNQSEKKPDDSLPGREKTTRLQMKWMRQNVDTIYDCMGVQPIFDALRGACPRQGSNDFVDSGLNEDDDLRTRKFMELNNTLTLMYIVVEAARFQIESGEGNALRDEIASLEPDYLLFLVQLLSNLRWDESVDIPLTKVLLLFWKSILLLFGSTKQVEETKDALSEEAKDPSNEHRQPSITASPLDYHLFRQEITSKYPAYNPPPPLLPLEPENNSILPPLPNRSRASSQSSFSGNGGRTNGSILHQPVHIATPAPSPPPSPAGPGGKVGKKQNYQTNQNFPFLYPPLDSSSNATGGKGSALLQDSLVSKKWEGTDIPTSILEAGTLFASRMRMTRAMRQLWEERERFMQFERGWGRTNGPLDQDELSKKIGALAIKKGLREARKQENPEVKRRVNAVEAFYRGALPHLQSVVIVLLKLVLANVTALITQPPPSSWGPNSGQYSEGNAGQAKPRSNGSNPGQPSSSFQSTGGNDAEAFEELSVEELEGVRSREIISKAVSGVLLLLLKWFKVSHVLKFEYMAQLLLDSNYLPLILKLFAHQELERVVAIKADRDDYSFFQFCFNNSKNKPEDEVKEDSEDEAVPPPIKLRREEPSAVEDPSLAEPPQVDELGNPLVDIPTEPITDFSWRNLFSSINYLRVMQKICKHKAHRNLLLVQYKSSQILKKCLKVPQPQLRLYTLKLFKNQVPYCGRKWRQSNMRVITAVYLHCRPELRDDWLAGSDIDSEVEESLPLEQALRALTHWYNLDRYPDRMGADQGLLDEEQDFFVRELEKMDWGDVELGEDAAGVEGYWEGSVQPEAW